MKSEKLLLLGHVLVSTSAVNILFTGSGMSISFKDLMTIFRHNYYNIIRKCWQL